MTFLFSKRLLFSCLYLGALFFVAGAVFYKFHTFSGTIFLPGKRAEGLAFRPAGGGLGIGLSQRGVSPELLMLDNPSVARILHRDRIYDGVVLPFTLRLQSFVPDAMPDPVHRLSIAGPDGERLVEVSAGGTVSVGDMSLTVEHLGPWEGLVRSPSGPPMAVVTVGSAAPGEGAVQFLESGRWYYPTPELAVRFQWHENQMAAAASYVDRLTEIDYVRWGVRDGRAMQWFQNLVAGTGTRLRDGREVKLIENRGPDGIVVEVRTGGSVVNHTVNPNEHGEDALVLLESPAATGCALMLHAWREDEATVRLLVRDQDVQKQVLPTGTDWNPGPPLDLPIRLNQVMGAAVAVRGDQVSAAFIRAGGRLYALREGLVETIGERRIGYHKEQSPPEGRYTIVAEDAKGVVLDTFSLDRRDSARVGSWMFSLAEENPFAPDGIALSAVRRPGGAVQVAGIILFLVGSFGLVVVRGARTKA